MGVKEELNKKYQTLCGELGDLCYKTQLFEKRIKEIQSEIELLNNYMPALDELERKTITQEILKSKVETKPNLTPVK